jgi:hypothetical protein
VLFWLPFSTNSIARGVSWHDPELPTAAFYGWR